MSRALYWDTEKGPSLDDRMSASSFWVPIVLPCLSSASSTEAPRLSPGTGLLHLLSLLTSSGSFQPSPYTLAPWRILLLILKRHIYLLAFCWLNIFPFEGGKRRLREATQFEDAQGVGRPAALFSPPWGGYVCRLLYR